MPSCPTPDALDRYLSQTSLPGDLDTDAVESHLSGCAVCTGHLQARTDDPELRDWLRHDAPPATRHPMLAPPRRPGDLGAIDGFDIETEIGAGGMGVVYRGRDVALGRPVAVKVLRPGLADRHAQARFAREAAAAAGVRHDHLVPVYSVGRTAAGGPYVVMPLVPGPTLRQRLRAEPTLTPREAAEVVRQVADGLDAAHAAGLVHRDVKPSNVLLDAGDGRAKLTDFGLARRSDRTDGLTRDGVLAGTPEYMSPEQAAHPDRADARSDVYSLGATLYELLAGVPPFRGAVLDVFAQHQTADPVPPARLNARVPRDLETVCLAALAKDPGRRYQSAAALRDDLANFLEGKPVAARPAGPVERCERWVRRHPWPTALLLVAVLGAGASAAGWRRAWQKAHEAEQSATDARDRRTEADERAGLALSAVNTLVAKAQELPDAAPGALAIKRQLTEAGLDDLRRLTAAADVPGAELTAAAAHLTLADALNLLGRTDDALAEWEQARRAAESVAADPRAGPLAARTHTRLGAARNALGQHSVAAAHYATAIGLLEAAQQDTSHDPQVLAALAAAVSGRGDVARDTGGPSLAEYERALALNRRAAAAAPADEGLLRKVAYSESRVGYGHLYPFQDHAAAEPLFREEVALTTAGCRRRPGDTGWRHLHLNGLLDLAHAQQRGGAFDAAEANCKEAIAGYEAAVAAAPENGLLVRQLGIAYSHLSWVEVGRGRFAEADALQTKALAQLQNVADRCHSPALVLGDFPFGHRLRARLSSLLGRYDEAADRTGEYAAAAIKSYPVLSSNPQFAAQMRDIPAALRLVPRAVADPAVVAAQPKGVADALAVFRADALARSGDLPTARREIAALVAARPADALVRVNEAGIFGRSAEATTDPAARERFPYSRASRRLWRPCGPLRRPPSSCTSTRT